MGIVKFPKEVTPKKHVTCVICERRISLKSATAGLLTADNEQAFACNGHFWSNREYIVGWADFTMKQRWKTLIEKNEGGDDAWTLC